MNVSPDRHSSVSSPPNRNSASGPCVPLTDWASRKTAPFDRPIADEAELAPRMMSGSVTFSRVSVHANAGGTTRHARTRGHRGCRSNGYLVMGEDPPHGRSPVAHHGRVLRS